MTCIVAYVAENKDIWMAADSATTAGLDRRTKRQPKIFIKDEFIIGVTGYTRMQQIMQYSFTPPVHPAGMDDEEYMCTLFVNEFRDVMKNLGYAQKYSEQEYVDSKSLIGYHGRLYVMESNFQIMEHIDPYDAVGCGEPYALGALYAMDAENRIKKNPHGALILALYAAARYSAGVSEPFYVRTLPHVAPAAEPVNILMATSAPSSMAHDI